METEIVSPPVEKRRLRQQKYWNNRTEEQKEKDRVRHLGYTRANGKRDKENYSNRTEEQKERYNKNAREAYRKKKEEQTHPTLSVLLI